MTVGHTFPRQGSNTDKERGRAHDVPNLFVSDGSLLTTMAAANPTLTIVALAFRQADHIHDQLRADAL